MKPLTIPDEEKAKGMIWVEYPVCVWEPWWRWAPEYFAEEWEPMCVADLQIRQGANGWS